MFGGLAQRRPEAEEISGPDIIEYSWAATASSAGAICKVAKIRFTAYLGIVGFYAHRNQLAHPRSVKPGDFVKPGTDCQARRLHQARHGQLNSPSEG